MYFDSHLASFGALLALTTLAVDPFPQASVSLKHCEHVTGHVASIPRTNNYTRNVALTGTHANAPDAGMQLAIYWGVLEPPDNSSVSKPSTLDCLTGNCTFPAEQGASCTSLAMCAYAWDVSDYIDGEMVDERRNFSLGPGRRAANSRHDSRGGQGPWNQTSMLDVRVLGMRYPKGSNFTSDYSEDMVPAAFIMSFWPWIQSFAANITRRFSESNACTGYLGEPATSWPSTRLSATALGRGVMALTIDSTDANIVPVYPPPPKYDSTDDNDDDYSSPGDPSWHTQECVFGLGPAPATVLADVSGFARGLAVAIGARMRTDSGSPAELSRASGRQDEPKFVSA
ncbi:hypothetical protein MAA_11328 [Metarhizium robertsii ARSEF 23]|uniref:Uncharacterized protein n=1 Tax=Metarhizium robertsii (strain ARSEF 23 / ATCC MYA-3075) TaxID=655844 RepID=A0A0B2XGD3_METRA|nr:uncharacterized protein MAA_11328 [Metarhizium robertsii ARSEF 23]KHO11059.1 hypothetical protein MAA_11328 [Metarhizium robertsii ARSEF 23]